MDPHEVRTIGLAELSVNPSHQPRISGLDEQHVRELSLAPDSWPELVAVKTAAGLVLVDGYHRYEAARISGIEAIRVRVFKTPANADLRGLAFTLNVRHGKALTHADRMHEAERLLREQPRTADREIGRHCGIAANTVGNLRRKLESSGELEAADTRVGSDGHVRTVAARQPGEMPLSDLGEDLANLADLVRGKRDRREQRRISSYLERIAIALDDQDRLPGWTSAAEAAAACRVRFSEDEVPELAERLGVGARRVLDVAVLLKKGSPR